MAKLTVAAQAWRGGVDLCLHEALVTFPAATTCSIASSGCISFQLDVTLQHPIHLLYFTRIALLFLSMTMSPPTNRKEILESLRKQIKDGKAIVGAGAGKVSNLSDSIYYKLTRHPGIGLSAKFVEAGGGDLIIIYNSGRFRMAGRGSLAGLMPYSNANDVVVEMASEVLPVVQHTPVIAGVCASDPFRDMGRFLKQLKDLGFAGVQNFPTVGLIDGTFRANLEET